MDKDVVQAAYWFRKAAEQGDVYGQILLADAYFYGIGVEQNYVQAAYWNRKAAEQGAAEAQLPH